MKIKIIGAVCALALGFTVSSLLAADTDGMKPATTTPPTMGGTSPEMKAGMKPDTGMSSKMEGGAAEMKASPLYTVQCGSPCDFEVKSHDKQEVIALALTHIKTHHNMTMATEKDVEAMVKTVEPAK
jgi:predicted small metal-binding protein